MTRKKSSLWLKKPKCGKNESRESKCAVKLKTYKINWTEVFESVTVSVKSPAVSKRSSASKTISSSISISSENNTRFSPVKKSRSSAKRKASPFKRGTPTETIRKTVVSTKSKTPTKSPCRKRTKHVSARSLFSDSKNIPNKEEISATRNEEGIDETFIAFPLRDIEDACDQSENDINVRLETPMANNYGLDNTVSDAEFENGLIEMELLMPSVMQKLAKENLSDVLLNFFKLVDTGNFPLKNIAFLLWKEVVLWYSYDYTTAMRYSDATKQFWKLGWRLFGGKFIRFMSGFKNSSQVVLGESEKGKYFSKDSDVNFAVPSFDVLRQFIPYGETENCRKPGIFKDAISAMSKAVNEQSVCLTYDGKKLKQGLTETSGDVDLIGFEDKITLREKQEALKENVDVVTNAMEGLESFQENMNGRLLPTEDKMKYLAIFRSALTDISTSILKIREVRRKKEYTKQKLTDRGGDSNWRNGKYVYAISAIIAFIYDIDNFLQKASSVRKSVCICISYIENGNYVDGKTANLCALEQYNELKTDENVLTDNTRLIKQRTDSWVKIRQAAKITGSTIYKALGFEGLQKQKEHFETVICNVQPRPATEELREILNYGIINEPNAAATLIAKVLPVVYPKLTFFEEGCVEMYISNGKPFMVVSPDGSLRSDKELGSTVMAVEFKCPVFQLQTEFPPRYYLQCLSEMEALNVESLIYLCWRPEESTVFKVNRDTDLFTRCIELANSLYGSQKPKKPTKIAANVKVMKSEIEMKCKGVEFIGLFDSVSNSITAENSAQPAPVTIGKITSVLHEIRDAQYIGYNLTREKASEAMLFLCCDLDRNWKNSRQQCAPVCWFPKGYSLPTETLRKISEKVLMECHNAGMHIPAQAFDGQWHNIVVRSKDEKPLTVLQLQKDVWKSVERTQKSAIIKTFRQINKDPKLTLTNGVYTLTNEGTRVPILKLTNTKPRRKEEQTEVEQIGENVSVLEVIPESVIQEVLEQEVAMDVLEHASMEKDLAEEISSIDVSPEEWTRAITEQIVLGSDVGVSPELQQETESLINIESNQYETEKYSAEIDGSDHLCNEKQKTNNASNMRQTYLNTDDAACILAMFQTDETCNRKGQWNASSSDIVLQKFTSYKSLETLRDVELRVITRYMKRTLGCKIKESATKQIKLDEIANILGITKTFVSESRQRISKKQPKSLADLCLSVLNKVSKQSLNQAYAEYIWPSVYKDWIETSPLKDNPKINTSSKPNFWFYVADFSEKRNQLEVRCIDSTHLLTRTRRKSCKGGLDGLPNTAWLKVAKSKTTFLSAVMVEEVVEPMSVSMAVTHFSESVENAMRQNGDVNSADLCRDIRHWWKAEDDPGIAASDRVNMRWNLRDRLLNCVNFGHFPPPTMHVQGWPLQLWEAIIANIDAKALLYSLCRSGTYNVRAFSSMMGETFFSELTQQDRRGHGTVTTAEFGQFVGTAIEQLQIRLDPKRTFSYRTARTTAYKLVNQTTDNMADGSDQLFPNSSLPSNRVIKSVVTRDHFFDQEERKRLKGKKKEAVISFDRNAVERGTLGVRYEKARRNDSKLLVTDRMSLNVDEEGLIHK